MNHHLCMRRQRLLGVVPLLVLSCTSPDPLAAWRDRVTIYIGDQGRGDPTVLRELVDSNARSAHRPARLCIGALGGTDTRLPRSKDILGVLVGQYKTADRNWYVFLVGTMVHRGEERVSIRDLRAAAFSWDRSRLYWQIGTDEPQAVKRYLQARTEESGLSPRRARSAMSFPGLFDVYQLEGHGYDVNVRETRSGATWKLRLIPHPIVPSIASAP